MPDSVDGNSKKFLEPRKRPRKTLLPAHDKPKKYSLPASDSSSCDPCRKDNLCTLILRSDSSRNSRVSESPMFSTFATLPHVSFGNGPWSVPLRHSDGASSR